MVIVLNYASIICGKMVSCFGIIFYFQLIKQVEHMSLCSPAIYFLFFCEMLFQIFPQFIIVIVTISLNILSLTKCVRK